MAAITDPIADMLTRIRNGLRARHARVDMPSSKLKVEIARILKDEGYIANFKLAEEGKKKTLRIFLRYTPDGDSVISSLERVSRPGRRVYVGAHKVPRVMGGMGINILTTPQGLMTGKAARKAGVGGELLCQVS
jgi:small subunit ribosomal protein S8